MVKKKPLSMWSLDARNDVFADIVSSFPSLLSPPCDSTIVLHSIDRTHICIMGTNYTQSYSTRCYVLVLFPECARRQDLVEGVDHPSPNYAICD